MRLSISVGATVRFSIQVALVDADLYFDAIFESGRSWVTGILEQAFSSASVLFTSSFDRTALKLIVGWDFSEWCSIFVGPVFVCA